MTRRLSAVDWAFLQGETATNLAHIAGLWVFELPAGDGTGFWREYLEGLAEPEAVRPPFNLKVNDGFGLPSWVEDPEYHLDRHVHRVALPEPGSDDQLLQLVSRVHSRPLDRSRPLWECYLIEGLSGGRVAWYFKVHHALLDGTSALASTLGAFSESPEASARRAFWQLAFEPTPEPQRGNILERLNKASAELVSQVKTLPELSKTVVNDALQALHLTRQTAEVPFSAPRSPLGKNITSERRIAVRGFSLSRVKKLGRATGSTVNDLVLAMSAGALRAYFMETGELPERPLTAWVPVSTRAQGDGETGNQVVVMVCSLATEVADPVERTEAIKSSVRVAKDRLETMSVQTSQEYTMLLSGAVLLTQQLGIADRIAPAANVVISNVPGPRAPLYINGAKLVGQYPMSMLIDGQGLNITVTSHDERLDFGLLVCPRAVPDPQRLADLLETALTELENEVATRS